MAKNNKTTRRKLKCIASRQWATILILSGTSLLLPSALSLSTYFSMWIPQAQQQSPQAANTMKLALGLSVVSAVTLVGGTLLYLKKEKCL